MKRISRSDPERLAAQINSYQKLYRKNPRSKIFAPLADEYRRQGRLDEALQMCLKGVRIHPGYSSGRFALGKCYFDKRLYDNAIRELEEVCRVNPYHIMAQTYLGKAYFAIKNYEKALNAFKKVQFITPKNERINTLVDRLEAKTKIIGGEHKKIRGQLSLRELIAKSLHNVETDAFVVRPLREIFSKTSEQIALRSLSPSRNRGAVKESLHSLFLTQGFTEKAKTILPEDKKDDFVQVASMETLTTLPKPIKTETVLKSKDVKQQKANLIPLFEENSVVIVNTVKERHKSDHDVFPEINMGVDEDYKSFDGYDPSAFYGAEEEKQSRNVNNLTIDRLSELLNRIQERAY